MGAFIDPGKQSDVSFLWEKWRYHDELLHRRDGQFWALELAYLGLVATLASVDSVSIPWAWLVPLVGGLALLAWSVAQQRLADREARNAYNLQLIRLLAEAGVIEVGSIRTDDWSPTKVDHPANMWHLGTRPRGYPGGLAKSLIDNYWGQVAMVIVNAAVALCLAW